MYSGSLKIFNGSGFGLLQLYSCAKIRDVPPLKDISFGNGKYITIEVVLPFLSNPFVKLEYAILQQGLHAGLS